MKKIENNKSYISANKKLIKEWNFKKNLGKNPTILLEDSEEIVWWKCEKGHEWQESISKRVKGKKCPGCFSRRVIEGLNDLKTIKPNLALEWDYEKNGNLKPENVKCASNRKVWWKCKKGHSWEAVISSRYYGTKCPVCTNKTIEIGFNDLVSKYPELVKEWNYEKNNSLIPENVTANSNRKVWWKCKKGHEWEAVICARTRGNKCPYCAGHKAIKGLNDLASKRPDLLLQWNYEKNEGIYPDEISFKSHKKVWWKCEKGHEWESQISAREKGNGCAVCSNKKIIKGINDLATTNPKLAEEWNYEKNVGLTPYDVPSGSNKRVWWKCEKGHEFEGVINTRNYKKSGCPVCSNRKIIPGINDLKTLNPKLASEWNYKRNKGLKPNKVACGSNKVVWWKCRKDHEWLCSINDRNQGHNCPICQGKRVKEINKI
ncbi:MAG: hypothetical protein E7310_05060 [Clostridiales bacterium]|nr:hypothetical protein [Clostridiales bacterium]